MAKLRLSVACGDYDIVKPLIEGAVHAEDSTSSSSPTWARASGTGVWAASTNSTSARRTSAPIS